MEPNFIRIGPPVVARTQSYQVQLFFEYRPSKVLSTHKSYPIQLFLGIGPPQGVARTQNHASDTGGWGRVSDCCSYTQE
jgi:hypothetical protein